MADGQMGIFGRERINVVYVACIILILSRGGKNFQRIHVDIL
jgi:hypothetical protein